MVVWHPLIYGLATFIMVLLNSQLLPIIFKRWYKEQGWTLGKEILVMCWQILTISYVNLVITHLLFGERMNLASVLNFLLITFSVGIFPVAFILLIKQQLLYKKFAQGASVIEKDLQSAEPVAPASVPAPMLLLKGENQGEELALTPGDFRFITAADNYLKVNYVEKGKLSSRVIRSTLRKAEEMVKVHPALYRCHRAYIVNLSAVQHVSGNAQGIKLHLKDVDEVIPVSRALNDELREKLKTVSV